MGIFSIDPYAAGAAFAAFLRRRRGFAAPAVFLVAFLAAFLRRFGAAFLAAAFLVVRFFDVFLAAATYFSCQLGSIRHRTC